MQIKLQKCLTRIQGKWNCFTMKKLILTFVLLLISFSIFASPSTVIGEDEIEKLNSFDKNSEIYRQSRPTGRMRIPGLLGIADYCTVSLISPNEILTAAHCLKEKPAEKLTVYFEYYSKDSKKNNPYRVLSIKYNSPVEDIAILVLEDRPGEVYGHYHFAKKIPKTGSSLYVFQHPGLDEKSISRKNCHLLDFDTAELAHSCDTHNYSSGSPILNEKFEIVGVHQGSASDLESNTTVNYGRIMSESIDVE